MFQGATGEEWEPRFHLSKHSVAELCLHTYRLASHSHTVVWHLPVVPKQLLLSSAWKTARGWYIFKRDFPLPPLFQEGFLHRSVASSHKYWCENDWEVLLCYWQQKAKGCWSGESCFHWGLSQTSLFEALRLTVQNHAVSGTWMTRPTGKLTVLSNHRLIHNSFWKLSISFPEHSEITHLFLQYLILLKSNFQWWNLAARVPCLEWKKN